MPKASERKRDGDRKQKPRAPAKKVVVPKASKRVDHKRKPRTPAKRVVPPKTSKRAAAKKREVERKPKQPYPTKKFVAAKSERQRDVDRKREERAAGKEVIVPPCEDRERREELEQDDIAWQLHYFGPNCGLPDPFWYDFTKQQIEMIEAIAHAIRYGGDQAIAASRGEGKSTICERQVLKYALQGILNFSVLFQATGTAAENALDSIKSAIEENVLLLADYPEVCVPVQSLENTPNRAHYQLVSGRRHDNDEPYERASSKFSWCGQEIVFPNVPGSPSARFMIATRGLDSAVRGLKRKGRRPQLALIDDPETEETVRSSDQATKLEERIDRGIAGLGGQQQSIARVMLTTLQNRTCVSFKYTDSEKKPTWKGKRFRFLVSPPDRTDLWEEYVTLRGNDFQEFSAGRSSDQHCRQSHQFYLDHRSEMDAGAQVANENRFDSTPLPDGTTVEASALQHYYNQVARLGADAVAAELDNDPAEALGPVESGITPHLIQRKVNGLERRQLPAGVFKITRGVDVRKIALHWVVRAWMEDGTPYTIDYGVYEVKGTTYGSDEGLDIAIKNNILAFLEESQEWYGRKIDRTLIDARWRTDAVYAACVQAGLGVQPVMGHGRSAGCVQANFHDVLRRTTDRKPGDGWFMTRKGGLWLVNADADRWKAWEHDRWMSKEGPGCMTLFGSRNEVNPEKLSADERGHHSYSHHICSEVEVEEPHKGVMRRRWKVKSSNNHLLDSSYYCDVAASIEGVPIIGAGVKKLVRTQAAGARPTAAQLAKGRR